LIEFRLFFVSNTTIKES